MLKRDIGGNFHFFCIFSTKPILVEPQKVHPSYRCSWFLTLTSAPSFSKSSVMSAWFSITASINGVFPSCQSNHKKTSQEWTALTILPFNVQNDHFWCVLATTLRLLSQSILWVGIYSVYYAVLYINYTRLFTFMFQTPVVRVVNTVIIWNRPLNFHLVLCIDVGWVLQELKRHG